MNIALTFGRRTNASKPFKGVPLQCKFSFCYFRFFMHLCKRSFSFHHFIILKSEANYAETEVIRDRGNQIPDLEFDFDRK